ncbi:MAG: hypothetical protein JWQ88_2333 [Rhodoferax sp.]|nr:hypothetical protein [Rhodoferax sp.]
MVMKKPVWLVAAVAALLFGNGARASLYTQDHGGPVPGYGPNDDGVFLVTVPFAVAFANGTTSSFEVSNNGYLFSVATGSALYGFGADLDSRNDPLAQASVHYRGTPTEAVFTWDRMGRFSTNYATRYTFQIVLNPSTVGFFYGEGFPAQECSGFGSCSLPVTGATRYYDTLTGTPVAGLSNAVPEPATAALMAFALVGLAVANRRQTRRPANAISPPR